MSIALDTAVFLRENKKIKITMVERATLLTLCFRVGSNAVSWVSQKELMSELSTNARSLKETLRSLVKKRFIEITIDKKDKRKNLYKINESLINYAQKPTSERTKVKLKKVTDQPRTFKKSIDKNYIKNLSHENKKVRDSAPINVDRCDNPHLYRCDNPHLLSEEKNPLARAAQGLARIQKSPKGKKQIDIKNKLTAISDKNSVDKSPKLKENLDLYDFPYLGIY